MPLCLFKHTYELICSVFPIVHRYRTLSSPPSTSLPELPGVSPAPLSLSSGGLAGRSDRERGARPPCTASSVEVTPRFGGMLRTRPSSVSSGGADGRRVPSPLRCPWREADRARTGLSSRNKPARLGRSCQLRDQAFPSRARRGGGIGGAPLILLAGGLDLVPPAARGHRGWWRAWWSFFSASADLGGWKGRRSPHFRSIGAALLLLLTLLLAGRGGEGLEVRMDATAAGGDPRSSSSNDGGVMETSGKVTPAWCGGLPGSDLEAPSSNKLKTGWILDLGLGSSVTPSPSPPQMLLCVVQVLPTGRGDEGKNGDDMPQPW
jgi:hypothetical protein